MAFTKAELEALKNAILASNQPITASQHRAFVQNLIDEMYDAQSRGNLLAGVQDGTGVVTGDEILFIRGGQAYLVPASVFGAGASTLAALGDVVISDPQDDEILVYNSVSGKWENTDLSAVLVTQAQLTAALANYDLFKGYFANLAALEALPGPFLDGSWALVGTAGTFQHYDWDKTAGAWAAIQGEQGPPGVVDLAALDLRYLRRDIPETVDEPLTVDQLTFEDTTISTSPVAYLGVLANGRVVRVQVPSVPGGFYTEITPAATVWVINHGFGRRPGGYIARNNSGQQIFGTPDYPTLYQMTLTFPGAVSGDISVV